MIETDMIQWTPVDRRPAANGDTQYRGTFDGVAMFVIHGTGRTPGEGRPADRRFSAFRLTSAGTEHPVGAGGQHKTLRAAKAACADELDSLSETGRRDAVESLKERRTLLGVLDAVGAAREAHRMTVPELREAVAALKGRIEITPTGASKIAAAVERNRAAVPAAELSQRVSEYDDGATVWRVGDRVKFPGPVCEIGDVWRIRSIAVPTDRPPYAWLDLAHRAGGRLVGIGTALGLRHLSRVAAEAPHPSGGLLSDGARKALRLLRDDHLPSWLAEIRRNNVELGHPNDDVLLAVEDVRSMIADVARELGVEL